MPRLVLISDTHNMHEDVLLPHGDILLHAGDFSGRGRQHEVQNFMQWFGAQAHPHKVLIAGNHDFMAETHPEDFRKLIPAGVTYLENGGATVMGLNIWGSPVTPRFMDWAFNVDRGPKIQRYWDGIPAALDVLITHGPARGQGDMLVHGESAGCDHLLSTILQQKPRLHLFGHIHEGHGLTQNEDTLFANASILDERYNIAHPPMVMDIDDKEITVISH